MDEWNLFEAAVECFSFCRYAIAPLVILHLFLQRLSVERHLTPAARDQFERQVLEWLSMPRPPEPVEQADFYRWFVADRKHCHLGTIKKLRPTTSKAAYCQRIRRTSSAERISAS